MNPLRTHQRQFERRLTERIRSKNTEAQFKLRQAQGKLRRLVMANLRKEATSAALELRQGECNRCGACCELLFKCPFLKKHQDGTSTCGIYEHRPKSCRLFPIDRRDLREVRGGICSYTFIEKPVSIGRVNI